METAMQMQKEIEALSRMTVGHLRQDYTEAFGEESRSNHKQFLFRRIAWRIQALAEGVKDHALLHVEIMAWPPGDRETITRLGVTRRTTDATALICEDCGESHTAEIIRDPSRPELPYYLCPRIGRVPVAVAATHRWEVDFDCLAALIRKAIGLGGKA